MQQGLSTLLMLLCRISPLPFSPRTLHQPGDETRSRCPWAPVSRILGTVPRIRTEETVVTIIMRWQFYLSTWSIFGSPQKKQIFCWLWSFSIHLIIAKNYKKLKDKLPIQGQTTILFIFHQPEKSWILGFPLLTKLYRGQPMDRPTNDVVLVHLFNKHRHSALRFGFNRQQGPLVLLRATPQAAIIGNSDRWWRIELNGNPRYL